MSDVDLESLRLAFSDGDEVLDDIEWNPASPADSTPRAQVILRRRDGREASRLVLATTDAAAEAWPEVLGDLLWRRREASPDPLREAFDPAVELGSWGDNPRDGGDTEVVPLNFGPLHAITRGRFRLLLKLDGEEIVRAAAETGYAHRGLEVLAPRRGWLGFLPLADRWCERSSVFARLAWCQVLEAFAEVEIPSAAARLRVALAELERIAAHAEVIAETLAGFGETAATRSLARAAADLRVAWAGLGPHPGRPCPGGFEGGPENAAVLERGLRDPLAYLVESLSVLHALTIEDAGFAPRMRGVATLGAAEAAALGASGPVLRATGRSRDARHDESSRDSAWRRAGLRPEAHRENGGDVGARTRQRFAEIRASLRLLDRLAAEGWSGAMRAEDPRFAGSSSAPPSSESLFDATWRLARATGDLRFAPGEVRVRVEAPQGTLGIVARAGDDGRLADLRLRGPDLFHLQALTRALPGTRLDDLEATVASFDLLGGGIDG
jgi:NADH:ubiquinone oxidoreductase subunit D